MSNSCLHHFAILPHEGALCNPTQGTFCPLIESASFVVTSLNWRRWWIYISILQESVKDACHCVFMNPRWEQPHTSQSSPTNIMVALFSWMLCATIEGRLMIKFWTDCFPFCRTLTIWCYQCDAALDPFKDEGTLLSPAAKVFLKTVARCLVTCSLNTICNRKKRWESKEEMPLCMIPFSSHYSAWLSWHKQALFAFVFTFVLILLSFVDCPKGWNTNAAMVRIPKKDAILLLIPPFFYSAWHATNRPDHHSSKI